VRFYKLEDPSPRSYQYAVEDTAFAGFERTICPDCGRELASVRFEGPHCLIAEGGPRYPDHLPFCGAGGPMLVLSRRAVEIFRENGISGIGEVQPLQVRKAGQTPLPGSVPDYCLVTVSGKIELDLESMCLKKKRLCPSCGSFDWNRQRMPKLCVDEGTWDGSSLCRAASIPGYLICTEELVALVKQYRLKGFSFTPIG